MKDVPNGKISVSESSSIVPNGMTKETVSSAKKAMVQTQVWALMELVLKNKIKDKEDQSQILLQ